MLAWRLANTLTTHFCIEAVQEAVINYGAPTIFNIDQGCQFTRLAFTGILKAHGIQISRDGTGCWRDNMFVERLWKSIKFEEVYFHAYETVGAAQQELDRYLTFYNRQRPHRALNGKTPDQVYCDNLTTRLTAALSEHREAPLKAWNILSKQLGPHLYCGLKCILPLIDFPFIIASNYRIRSTTLLSTAKGVQYARTVLFPGSHARICPASTLRRL